jgi:hypothetical protein
MTGKWIVSGVLFVLLVLAGTVNALASFVIQAQEAVSLEIRGYRGLADSSLFAGELAPGVKQSINTSYRGLALLVFEKGQQYPVILGERSFVLKIENPDTLPSFTSSDENEFFYNLLTGVEPGGVRYDFPLLMIEAKQLLDSTHSIHTVKELQAMKERFHTFATTHYQDLQRSDVLMRLIAQYFMMHEYVDYTVQDGPATAIRERYEEAVMDGVRSWLRVLKPHIPQHEILNYCVSLYYNRSMTTLASRIIEKFHEVAYCPGAEKKSIDFPPDLNLTDSNGSKKTLQELGGKKIIAFVSDNCPVSMVETVIEARRSAQQSDTTLIVVPLQQLSGHHLAMRRMVSGGNMLFVDDEKWRKEHLADKLKLPLIF